MEESPQLLLQQLKIIAEGLLITQTTNVWNIYGGLNRLCLIMEKIFKHGLNILNQSGEKDFWIVIDAFNFIEPILTETDDQPKIINYETTNKGKVWLRKSLESHTLSQELANLLTHKEHLLLCYKSNAYLRQEAYSDATLICLKSIEQNQLSMLTDINPSLYLSNSTTIKLHRRSSSFPEGLKTIAKKYSLSTRSKSSTDNENYNLVTAVKTAKLNRSNALENFNKHLSINKKWHSLPCLSKIDPNLTINKKIVTNLCKSQPSSPAISSLGRKRNDRFIKELKVNYAELQKSSSVTKPTSVYKCESVDNLNYINLKLLTNMGKSSKQSRSSYSENIGSKDETNNLSNKNPSVRKSLKKRRKDSFRVFSVPHSIWEESDTENASSISDKMKIKSKCVNHLVQSAPERVNWQKVKRKKSFIEDGGGNSVQPMSTRYFPRPTQGQSLTSFLSSSQFARANAELDRENAHFSISEAIISAIEQVKCNRWMGLMDESIDESDEEINCLKQRIRMRRQQKAAESRRSFYGLALLSDGKTDTTTTDQSASPISSSPPDESSDVISTDEDVDDLELDQVTNSNLESLSKSGLSVSLASLFSEAELTRPSPATILSSETIVSAEGVALSLLRQFSDKHLPRASDLQWVVSEQDAPQQLLPIPKSWMNNKDDGEDNDIQSITSIRGTNEWAPPRPQIIFTAHPTPIRRVLMTKQNYRCAGCGMMVKPDYAHKYRYCEYLGRFFCTGCHTNQQDIIPGRIITKWDFNKYPVSNFSFRLLDQMFSDPLFNVNDLNSNLYRRANCLEKVSYLRIQLFYLKDFLFTCRFAKPLANLIHGEPSYIYMEHHLYSLQDFINTKTGELGNRLRAIINQALEHIKDCQLCQARGFVCEVCRSQEIIFPWQLNKVVRCNQCGACFHNVCYSPKLACPRCVRIARRNSAEVVDVS